MKKVLIITYYWPPSGGSGVQRWLKFAKYLPEFGWEPIIYTPENPERPATDESLFKDISADLKVIKEPIWEPYTWYRRILGKKDEKIGAGLMSDGGKDGSGKKLAVWIRGNFFIPDPRKFWVKPSVRKLSKYIQEHQIKHVITTGPPHSMHLIGLGLKKKLDINWIADFRDPWTNIDFYRDLNLSASADRTHRKLERDVLTTADLVISVGNTLSSELRELGASKVETITNGFDRDDFPDMYDSRNEKFTIAHIGSFSRSRNHQSLWQALKLVEESNAQLAAKLQILTLGQVDGTVGNSIELAGLSKYWERIDHVPHAQVLEYQRSSSVLLLMVNDTPNAMGILPGKLFEYMASGRPILCIGPTDGDAAKAITETGCGICVRKDDTEGLKNAILKLYAGGFEVNSEQTKIEVYSRRSLTEKLASALNKIRS